MQTSVDTFDIASSSTDLHLGNTSLHDNRDLPRDASIHRAPWAHEATLATGLLPPFLGPGTVTVGHIDDVSVLLPGASSGRLAPVLPT